MSVFGPPPNCPDSCPPVGTTAGESAAVAGSKLLYPDGTLQECGGIVWRLGDGWNWGRGQKADDPRYCYLRDTETGETRDIFSVDALGVDHAHL